jgi:hypothetical protein
MSFQTVYDQPASNQLVGDDGWAIWLITLVPVVLLVPAFVGLFWLIKAYRRHLATYEVYMRRAERHMDHMERQTDRLVVLVESERNERADSEPK